MRALGTFISDNVKENKKNIEVKIDNMNTKLDIWRARNLSLLGKCLIVKCLGIAHLVYSDLMLVIPNTYIPIIKNSVFNVIWNNVIWRLCSKIIVMVACVPPVLKSYLNRYI